MAGLNVKDVYKTVSRLYKFVNFPSDWFITSGNWSAWVYTDDEYSIGLGDLSNFDETEAWLVEKGTELDMRNVVKTIFNKETVFER